MIPSNQLYLNVVLSITGDGIHTSWPVIKCSCISHLIKALIEQHSTFWNEKPFRGGSVLLRQYHKMYYQTWKIMKHDSHKRWNEKVQLIRRMDLLCWSFPVTFFHFFFECLAPIWLVGSITFCQQCPPLAHKLANQHN